LEVVWQLYMTFTHERSTALTRQNGGSDSTKWRLGNSRVKTWCL